MNEALPQACISCGERNDGGYMAEDGPGPFCAECWRRLEVEFLGPMATATGYPAIANIRKKLAQNKEFGEIKFRWDDRDIEHLLAALDSEHMHFLNAEVRLQELDTRKQP